MGWIRPSYALIGPGRFGGLCAAPTTRYIAQKDCFGRHSLVLKLCTRNITVAADEARRSPDEKKKRRFRRTTSNLDPANLQMTDLVDIGNAQVPSIQIHGTECGRARLSYGYGACDGKQTSLPFPPGIQGWFYFHRRPNIHVAAGELRFRVIDLPEGGVEKNENSKPYFDAGWDLMKGKEPWRISLLGLRKCYPPVYQKLMLEGVITTQMDNEIDRLLPPKLRYNAKSRIIERVTDPFFINFGGQRPIYIFLHQERIQSVQFARPFAKQFGNQSPRSLSLYSGTAYVRLELATFPTTEGPKDKLVLRVLQFVDPPDSEDEFIQNEGQLVKKFNFRTNTEEVWTSSLPSNFITPSSLKMLEDARSNQEREIISVSTVMPP